LAARSPARAGNDESTTVYRSPPGQVTRAPVRVGTGGDFVGLKRALVVLFSGGGTETRSCVATIVSGLELPTLPDATTASAPPAAATPRARSEGQIQ
jgi:hypothetical protein